MNIVNMCVTRPAARLFCLGAVVGLLWLPTPGRSAAPSASADGLWAEVDASALAGRTDAPWIQPAGARVFALDTAGLQRRLVLAPMEFGKRSSAVSISVPMPDGTYALFEVQESPVMHPDLAAKFPGIKTYIGRCPEDPTASARFDWTPKGFHAQILKPSGAVYVDPYYAGNTVFYSSYTAGDYEEPVKDAWRCLVEGRAGRKGMARGGVGATLASGATLRTYRLAQACTGEYTAFHGGTTNAAMSAIVTTVNRVTGVYEVEVAVRLELVANNDLLIYLDGGTDPYTNDDGFIMLDENTSNLDSVIGPANFDIGHVFSTGGGGVAGLGVVCGAQKAEGVTGRGSPVGDPFDIDYVAHEMGHQFGGNHTFNGDSGSCAGGNRNGSTAYEPGSGSTIQAYAGICDNDDLQSGSDPFFHSESHFEIVSYITSIDGGCAVETATGNNPPTVEAGANYTIPQSTPFELTATGDDVDGDTLSYSWEERDLGPQQDVSAGDNGSSPIFRCWPPTTNATRTFPRLQDLVANTTAVGETLPTTGRTMMFRVTARDNRAGGGGVNSDDMQVTVDAASGPFLVTFPNGPIVLSGAQPVTWDVAGTSVGPVNAAAVDILLSTDGGLTWPDMLATNVANTGTAVVRLPDVDTTTARIKVRGHGNVFFDISDANFTIEPFSGLSVTPVTAYEAAGLEGGPFSPPCRTYVLSNDSPSLITWEASLTDVWATATPTNGTLAVGASTNLDVCLNAIADSLADAVYMADLVVSNVTAGADDVRQVRLTVEPIGGSLQFGASAYSAGEGDGAVTVLVHRVGNTAGAVSVTCATSNLTAEAGSDYGAASEVLAWGDGDSSPREFAVTLLEDVDGEGDEVVSLFLSGPTGGAGLGHPAQVPLTIEDNDGNDTCDQAWLIGAVPYTNGQSTVEATSAGDPVPDCVGMEVSGVWYRFTAPSNGLFTFHTTGSDFDTTVTFYSGGCGSLAEAACNDDEADGILTSRLSVQLMENDTIHILAGGYEGETGNLLVGADFVPGDPPEGDNDLCANAVVVDATPFLDSRATTSATSLGDPSPTCADESGNGVWYQFTADRPGILSVDLVGSDYDTVLAVYEGTCGALTEIDCNDDVNFPDDIYSATATGLSAGTTVYVLVNGWGGETGMLVASFDFAADSDGDGDPDATDPDDDNDTIPDVWELANGMDPLDAADAGEDGDGDGVDGLGEYLADTSPTNELSVFRVDLQPGPAGYDLVFQGSTAREYFVQSGTNLVLGPWIQEGTNMPGTGATQSLPVTNTQGQLYYRLGAGLP
jgi:hypothetical protein